MESLMSLVITASGKFWEHKTAINWGVNWNTLSWNFKYNLYVKGRKGRGSDRQIEKQHQWEVFLFLFLFLLTKKILYVYNPKENKWAKKESLKIE